MNLIENAHKTQEGFNMANSIQEGNNQRIQKSR